MTDEQGENLNDILGFDPSDSSSASDIPESRGVPKNLSRLEIAAKAAGLSVDELKAQFQNSIFVRRADFIDPNNLFAIENKNHTKGTERTYYKYDPNDKYGYKFEPGITTTINSKALEQYRNIYLWSIEQIGEYGDNEKFYYYDDKRINVYKKISNDRIVNIYFDASGNLVRADFGIFSGDGSYGIRRGENGEIEKYVSNKPFGSAPQRHLIPPDAELESDEDGMISIKMSRNGKVTDQFHVPEKINSEEITNEMMPQELLEKPDSPDLTLDYGARLMSPFSRINTSWEVFEEEKRSIPTQKEVDDA